MGWVGAGVIPETKNSAWEGRVGAIITAVVLGPAMIGIVVDMLVLCCMFE